MVTALPGLTTDTSRDNATPGGGLATTGRLSADHVTASSSDTSASFTQPKTLANNPK
jgi:hypothetical protein